MSEEDDKKLDGNLQMRINQRELGIFMSKSQRNTGKPYQSLLREVITAFNDGRLRIIPTTDQQHSLKSTGELYNVTGK